MLTIGQTISHYSVVSKLGKGGMGEVYGARDQILGRDVAIKVLPEEFARDEDRVARFQREAKLLASLNHPNIASIYGLEESGGTNFLVLELIEGDTLADRLKQGAIPVEESLKLALQIAEALEAAHEKNIIHRDLKPANIKVTPDGKVKVLDFGLAKAFAGEQEQINLSNSPTLSDMATQQGVILGTAAYMSPEQAKGRTVDKRADVWAFGCVVFEMLAGRSLFSADDVSQTLARVLERQPDFSSLPANLHPKIAGMLERCLEKDVRNRYSGIGDARVDIQQVLADASGVFVEPVTAEEPRKKVRVGLPWIVAAAILCIIVGGLVVWYLKPSEPRQVMRFDYDLPEGQQLRTTGIPLAVSPDGKRFVYSTNKGLYLRSVDELTSKLIAGTEGNTQQPFFSPDGKSIGYYSPDDRQLKKIALSGGAPVTLCAVTQLLGAWWNEDNTIVYGQYPIGPIMRVSANGGMPEALIKPESELLVFPQILPDGQSVLYTASTGRMQGRVMVQSLRSGEPKELIAGGGARYLPTGHLVYMLPGTNNLAAVPFDPDKLEVTGGPVPIIEGVLGAAVSEAGTLVYLPGTVSTATPQGAPLVWVDKNGKEELLTAQPNIYAQPKISPDGTRVALAVGPAQNEDLYVWDFVRKTLTRLTFDKTREMTPIWTPDGKRIIYWSNHEDAGAGGVYWKAADGSGEVEKLGSSSDRQLFPWSLSSDGKSLLIQELVSSTHAYISMMSMEGDQERKLLLQSEYSQAQPRISPDGRWMAYSSTESTGVAMNGDVYVRPFPEVNKAKWQVSTGGGHSPVWSPDGRELFYLTNENVMMAVSVTADPSFSLGTPKILFRSTNLGLTNTSGTPYDIHPGGKRFLMIKPPPSAESAGGGPRKINIVFNWTEELKQRVPVK